MRTNKWTLGWKDRGFGHGDYGILDEKGGLIAEIQTGLKSDADLIIECQYTEQDLKDFTDYAIKRYLGGYKGFVEPLLEEWKQGSKIKIGS